MPHTRSPFAPRLVMVPLNRTGITNSEKKLWIAIYSQAVRLIQEETAPTVRAAVDKAIRDVTMPIKGHDDGAGEWMAAWGKRSCLTLCMLI